MHASLSVLRGEKKNTNVVQFCNKNKVAVDVVDQMDRMCNKVRDLVGVWCNVLDLEA